MSRSWKLLFTVLFLSLIVIWLAVFSTSSKDLKVISCNVGQGDASLIVYKNYEILIDGGPNNRVLDCLSKYMPFWDREIEIVVLTHPQADHFTGLISVFEHYKVDKFLANSLDSSSQSYSMLKSLVGSANTEVVNPVKGMVVMMNMIQLDILHPSSEFLADNSSLINTPKNNMNNGINVLGYTKSSRDANDFSVIALLHFGSFNFLFTGDISKGILDDLALDPALVKEKPINYIKIPHHGSKSALSTVFYNVINPKFAVISVGKNSYGQPSSEIINMLKERNIYVYRTDEIGDIVIKSDGKNIWVDK